MAKPTGNRTYSGYCCERCDGPYDKWLKRDKMRQKAKEKHRIKKDIEEQLEQNEEQES